VECCCERPVLLLLVVVVVLLLLLDRLVGRLGDCSPHHQSTGIRYLTYSRCAVLALHSQLLLVFEACQNGCRQFAYINSHQMNILSG